MKLRLGVVLWAYTLGGCVWSQEPIRIHPENPKYFLFRGKPLVLLTATEHYGSVINRAFDFEKYLDDASAKRMTLTRTFLLFRELQTPRNPYSPCKPESPDFIAPFPRTGPGKALDGEPIYDLDQWNREYFDRLRKFLTVAAAKGIVVELTLFSNNYGDSLWELNPFHASNNKQGVGKGAYFQYLSLRDRALVDRQLKYVRKIVRETSEFDNLYYEICNEPGAGPPRSNQVTQAEVNEWQEEIARTLRDELSKLNRKHLVFGAGASSGGTVETDTAFRSLPVDAVNIHPWSRVAYGGRVYDLMRFMSDELRLTEYRDFFRAVYPISKPVVNDEDNAAACYRNLLGWTIHRKRAWTALLNGAHYDYIDFSVVVGREGGTPESSRAIRDWMKHLSEFIHSFDFVHAKLAPDWISEAPQPLLVSALAVEGQDYIAYLADRRELSEPSAGEPVQGRITLRFPPGVFAVKFFSPTTGLYSPATRVDGGIAVSFDLPSCRHDIALRATRVGLRAPRNTRTLNTRLHNIQ